MINFQSKIISLSVFALISASAIVSVEAQTVNSSESVGSADINATITDESVTTDFNFDNVMLDHGVGRGGRGDWDRGGRGARGDWNRGRGDHGRGRYYPPGRGDYDRGRGGYYPPGRGDYDRGRGGYNPPGHGGHYPPPNRGYYPPPNRGHYPPPNNGGYNPPNNDYYGSCNDQSVSLYCKINGVHQYINAYTSCGYSSEGSSCYNVSTPGYYQVAMRIAYRCQSGRWIWLLGNDGQCKLSY